ncbi:MAG: glutamate racemase [Pseudanabaenaceae cyanobacterium SKYGB_i_bin29]|nr:glutamate racemase [Pseudanabaenaceae cyanobacterium SKYG29]MDW8421708.1 glutamate racemase [Pseudanabaenaceae cyanobacterium SKYGB_i_bin29]
MGNNPQFPIGVFDSGVGGLTVLKEIYRQMPWESVIYFGDTARVPYGDRTPGEIISFVQEILTWFAAQQVKMVIMACNTSSALALEVVRPLYDFPILGLILPGARAAVQVGQRIGVLATPATVKSNAYRDAILESSQGRARVWQVACPEFVPLIEQGRIFDPCTIAVARSYLHPLIDRHIDTLVFGCTHYPHLAPVIREILPASVRLVDPAVFVTQSALQELSLLGLSHPYPCAPGRTTFYVSGCPEQFAQLASRWLGEIPIVAKLVPSTVRLTS